MTAIDLQEGDTLVTLPYNWKKRPYQVASWEAWRRGVNRLLLVWHRRAGKDEVALHMAAVAAHKRVANYWHCLPMYEQARKAIWEAINPHTGRRRIDEAFPVELRKRTDNSGMTIEFLNGSIWRVVGSDNPDSLVGAPPAGIVFSEWALGNPSAWGYLAPILEENGGWAVFITTPRGRNHVKSMLDMARASPTWYAEVLTPKETGFPLERVEAQRAEYQAIFGKEGGDALIDQEYWCSFEAAILGAYWGREMVAAEREGRITKLPYEPELPVHTAWDLGVGDDTAIWLFQEHFNQVRVIGYYENRGYAVDHYVEWLNQTGYVFGNDYVPHDARVREWSKAGPDGKAKSRVQTMVELGRKPVVVPQQRLEDSINAARRLLPYCIFDDGCGGLEALRQFRREWDDGKKTFKDNPLHDWASHGASAFRQLAWATKNIQPVPPPPPKPEPKGIADMTFDQLLRTQPRAKWRV
jgi:hypothetical protein